MKCPNCSNNDTKVIDSRLLQEGSNIRRRRKCEKCEFRFTTYEKIEANIPAVLKRDGRRESYNRNKIHSGLLKACQKRPISTDQLDKIIDDLECTMIQSSLKEFPSDQIGPMIMNKLKDLDHVAYVRFASFYWNYETVDTFIHVLTTSSTGETNEHITKN